MLRERNRKDEWCGEQCVKAEKKDKLEEEGKGDMKQDWCCLSLLSWHQLGHFGGAGKQDDIMSASSWPLFTAHKRSAARARQELVVPVQ